jgi:RHS repeat-associated protein
VTELGLGQVLTGTFQTRVGGLQLGTTVSVTVTATAAALPQPVAATVTLPIVEPAGNEAWVTPAGGWFRSADGRVRLHIPLGAVLGRTRFTYAPLTSLPNRPANTRLAFSLEAHDESGQPVRRFAAPLALTFCYTPQSLSPQVWEEPSLFYFAEAAQVWLPVPIRVDYQQRRLSADLEHFTVFAQTSETYMVERMSSVRGAQTSLFTGAESYRYSLNLPPGRAGLVPVLGFSYSSANHTPASGHFSLAGFGWETVGADSVYIPPGDANLGKPVLSLQGVTYSLRQTSDGTWFAKENPFLKIQVADVSHNTPGTWYVWTPDGTKYTFGTDQNPRSYYWKNCNTGDRGKRYVRLPLTRIDDPNGNAVTYTWQGESENSRVYVCEIDPSTQTYTRFVRLASISYNNSKVQVVFNYASRDDRPEGYDCDECWTFHTDKRLTSVAVQVYSGGAWNTIRTYTLQQSSGSTYYPSQKVLNLDWIEESSGGYALPRTELAYTDNYFSVQNAFGAIITITNGYGGAVVFQSDHRGGNETNAHVVARRTEKAGGSGIPDVMWTYAYGVWDYDPNNLELAQGYKNVTVTLPITGTEAYAFHTLLLAGDGQKIDHLAGREYQTQVLAGAQELVKNMTTWVSTTLNLPISGYSGMQESAKPRFVYADTVDTYQDSQTILHRQYYYQIERQGGSKQFGNVTEAREYAGTGGGWESLPIRTNYTWYYPNETTWITARPGRTDLYKVCAGCTGGQMVSQSLFYYDQAADYQTPPTKGLLSKRRDGVDAEQVTTAQYEYWANGNLRKVKDGNNNTTETFYDSTFQSCPVCVKNQLGHLTKTRYYGVPGSTDAGCTTSDGSPVWSGGQPMAGRFFGRVEEVLDPNAASTTYEYDWWGRPTKVIQPGDDAAHPTLVYAYYDNNLEPRTPAMLGTWRKRDPNATPWSTGGTWSRQFFDGLGRLIQVQTPHQDWGGDGVGHEIVRFTTYNSRGLKASESVSYEKSAYVYNPNCNGTGRICNPYVNPDLNQPKMQYSYDALGRVTQVTNFDGTTVRTYYQDRKTAILDELNHQTIREVDALGRLVAAKQYEGTYSTPNWSATVYAQATYTYNVRDQLTDVYDPASNRTQISYDTLGRKTGMTDPDMGTWSYAYDAVGNLKRQTDARNQTICFYYDALNRPLGKHYRTDTACPTPTPPSYNVSYTYDSTAGGNKGIGRRTGMIDASGNTSWTYDARGRVTQETKVINGTGGGTFKTQLSYYADDQVWTMTYPGGNAGQTGETVTNAYNPMGLVKSVVVMGASTYVSDTTYNALGQVIERRLGSNGVVRQLYSYTAAENFRLVTLKSGNNSPNYNNRQNISYTYDDTGNVLSITDAAAVGGSQTQSFTYHALNRLLTAQASGGSYGAYTQRSYTYNNTGNITSFEGTAFYYQDAAHKHAVTHLGGTAPSNQKYWYDANGNVTRRISGSQDITLSYDAESRLTGVSGGMTASYVYDGDGQRVKATVSGVTTVYVGNYYEVDNSVVKKYYYAGGVRIAENNGGTLYWLLGDHLCSTAVTTNGNGDYVTELRYYAWGDMRYNPGSQMTSYRFTGQRWDSGSGLYYYGARWYDPLIGRFIQADTIVPNPGNPQALNRYSYVYNNPLRYTDPTGLFTQDEIKQFFGKESWEDVLKLFEKGSPLEGRWGWLAVLQKAEIGDDITIHWDKDVIQPGDNLPQGESFSGKFKIDADGNLVIVGEQGNVKQIQAGALGQRYELTHHQKPSPGQAFAGAFLIVVADLFVGVPGVFLTVVGGGVTPVTYAGAFLDVVALSATGVGLKIILDSGVVAGYPRPPERLSIPAMQDSKSRVGPQDINLQR